MINNKYGIFKVVSVIVFVCLFSGCSAKQMDVLIESIDKSLEKRENEKRNKPGSEKSEPNSPTNNIPDKKVPQYVQTQIRNVKFKRLCPKKIGGDREFKGNGPKMATEARAYTAGSDVYVEIKLHAIETKRDWTEAKGRWVNKIGTFPGYKKVQIVSDDYTGAGYTDKSHSLKVMEFGRNDLVQRFESIGDTKGNDIGNCTADDVYLSVYFNPIKVRLYKY